MFCKKDVLIKFPKLHVKKSVLESPFYKVAGLQACDFIKKGTPRQVFSYEIFKIFKNTYFEEHLRTTASLFRKSVCNGVLLLL